MMTTTKGVGIYLRDLAVGDSPHENAKKDAKRAADHGLSFALIMSVWQDWKKNKPIVLEPNPIDQVKRYVDAFASKGILPFVWGYPWCGREAEFIDRTNKYLAIDGVKGLWLDPEVSYKWKSSKDAQVKRACATTLVEGIDKIAAVTSYGMADYHKNFPWDEFGGDDSIGSPQLYEVSPKEVDAGILSWRTRTGLDRIIPSVPTFGPKSGLQLHDFLSCFVDTGEHIDGFAVWSWMQTDSQEWAVLARWADWFSRGVL